MRPRRPVPEVLDKGHVDFFLLALPYTLADQSALDEDLPRCAARGVAVVIGAVFASGILATPALWAELKAEGLIRADAPTP
ncbi:MAG: hypothetical protein U1E53_06905 [Dongiaceae bacterium]